MTRAAQIQDADLARPNWFGPPLRTLHGQQFDAACAELMRQVEAHYSPAIIVGIRTGGFVVAEVMARFASSSVTVLPLTSRRGTTATKSRLPMLRHVFVVVPRPVLDVMRRVEHRLVTAPRASQPRPQEIDHGEAGLVAAHIGSLPQPARVLVVDDAVDSGVTLSTVLRTLRERCKAGTEIRSAAITQTLPNPRVRPDYVLFHGTLCRFPWSFDAR